MEMVDLLQDEKVSRFEESNIHELMSSNVSKMVNDFRSEIDRLSPVGKMSLKPFVEK